MDARLPPRPTPTLPVLRHPTRGQKALAGALVHKSFASQITETDGQRRIDQAAFVRQSLRSHPGTRRLTRVNSALVARNTNDALARLGRFYGAKGSRGEAVRLGARVQAAKVRRDGALRPGSAPHRSLLGVTGSLTTLDRGDLGPRQFVNNALGDVKGIAELPFVGGYELGAAGVEGVQGNFDRAGRLASGAWQGVRQSVPGRLVSGDLSGAADSFLQHPVYAALDLGGASSAGGRLAGAFARGLGGTVEEAGLRGGLARAGSTFRLPVGVNHDGGLAVAERTASKDMLRAGTQRSIDRQREFLRDSKGKVVTVRDPRRRQPVPVLKAVRGEERLLKTRRSDFEAARANAVERYGRERTARDVAKAERGGQVRGRLGQRAQRAVSMATEGTLRRDHAESGTTFKADVRKRVEKLEARISEAQVPTRARGRGYRSTKGVKAAREELAALHRLKDLSPEQVDRLFAAKDRLGRLRVAQDAEYARLGVAPAAQLERARLQPYALSHMDARHVTVEEHAALERDALAVERQARAKVDGLPKGAGRARALEAWSRAKAHRIDVSGRHPEGVRRHEVAAREARDAEAAVGKVEDRIAKLEARRKEIIGAQRVRRGAAPHNVAKGKLDLGRVERELQAAKAVRKSRVADARAARGKADRVRRPAAEAALRTKDAKFLSNEAIKAHMRAHGVDPDTIGQLTHKELGNRAFHKRFDVASRPAVSDVRRTGAAFERGESGFGGVQVQESAANAATTIAKVHQVDRFVTENALLHESGRPFTAKEALETAQRLEGDQGRSYVAVRLHGARLSEEAKAAARGAQSPRHFDELSSKLLNDRIVDKPGSSAAKNVALVDADQFNRLARHMQSSGELEKLIQMLNKPFRFSVLAQPRWLAGNFIEPFFVRLPMSGSGFVNVPGMLMDIRRSMKTLKSMEKSGNPKVRAAAEEIRAQQLGGLFIGSRGASNRRVTKDFTPKPGAGPVEAAAGKVLQAGAFIRNMPAVKQLADLAEIPPAAYFKANRVLIEQWAQHAALGRSIRKDLEELYGSWTKAWSLSDAAIKDARRGLMNTATQERFMRAQHELLGKYEGFSPSVRRVVQTIAPFLPWVMSAARFTMWTMPAHHSVVTALLNKTSHAEEQAWLAEHKDAPPGGLQLAVRTKDGGFIDLARYTPYGFSGPVAEGDLQGVTDQFMPQVSGAVAAVQGKDPFGRGLRVKPTSANPQGVPTAGDKAKIALYSLLEATAGPYWSLARRLQEGGGTAYADSTVFSPKTKPGSSHMSAVRRTLDPFRPTYLTKKAGATVSTHPELDRIRGRVGEARTVLDDPEIEKIREQLAGR